MNTTPALFHFVLLVPLTLVACAAAGSDTAASAGAPSTANGGSAGLSVGGAGSGASGGAVNVAGAPSAGASSAGDGAGGQAGAAAAGGGAGGSSAGSGGASGASAGAPSAGTGGNSGTSSAGSGGGSSLQDGIKPYFKTSDTNTSAAISAILGEMHVVNTDGGNATLSLLKVRYYFTNEGLMPLMQMNWAHLKSSGFQADVPYTATVVKLPTATATADSYIEFACNSANVLDAGKEVEISFRLYDGSNQPVFHQDNDYSFSATTTPTDKIVLLYRDAVIWGVAP